MFGNNQNSGMKQGTQNVFQVNLNGRTQTISGANSHIDAARQAFGSQGDKATVRQTETKKWL